MSKRDTPLLEGDVQHILGLSHEDYKAALSDGQLWRSIEVANDPTGRLAFHNFWDVLEFSLSPELATLAMMPAATDLAAMYCDELACDDHDIIAITGDTEADHAIAQCCWINDTAMADWPPRLLDHCTRLLVRTSHHIHAVSSALNDLGYQGDTTMVYEPRVMS